MINNQWNTLSVYSFNFLKEHVQLYLAIPPPDILPNLLISTNLLSTEFLSYIKPLIHMLYRHPPHKLYVQTRLHHKEKWIEYRHQSSISQWRNISHHNMMVDADMCPSTEQRWQSYRYRNSSVFICNIHTYSLLWEMVVVVGDLSLSYPAIPPNRLYRQLRWCTELGGMTGYYCSMYSKIQNEKIINAKMR